MYKKPKEEETVSPGVSVLIALMFPVVEFIVHFIEKEHGTYKYFDGLLYGNWNSMRSDPQGKWLYFLLRTPYLNTVLISIFGILILSFFGYNFVAKIRISFINKPKSTSLAFDSYLVYHVFSELQEKLPKLSETEVSELASAVFTDIALTDPESDFEKVRPFCSEEFYKKLCSENVDLNGFFALSARPYAWKEINAEEKGSPEYQIVVKIVAQPNTGEVVKTKEFDLFFVSVDCEARRSITNCPHCGGVIDFAKSNRCPYCDAELSRYLANWALDDIKQIA